MRVVVAGVGYRTLRDHSFGVLLSDDLAAAARPPSLVVEDLSYNPVAVAQWFADEARESPFTRAIFISAIGRDDGRAAGTLTAYEWDRVLPSADLVQRAVSDAVTGVILLDNTLIVAEWMRALPSEVIVVEVEPLVHAFGEELSVPVAAAYIEGRSLAWRLATDDAFARALPTGPLGGFRDSSRQSVRSPAT
jgi:hypothetical protein